MTPINIDEHIGRQLRRRRRLMGLTQQQLASAVGIFTQRIQKYECGMNHISAALLFQLAKALEVPISYFYDGLANEVSVNNEGIEVFSRKETLDLIEAYYRLSERPRRRLLELARSLGEDSDSTPNADAVSSSAAAN